MIKLDLRIYQRINNYTRACRLRSQGYIDNHGFQILTTAGYVSDTLDDSCNSFKNGIFRGLKHDSLIELAWI